MNWAMDLMKITLSCSVSISHGRSAVGSYLCVSACMRREERERESVCVCDRDTKDSNIKISWIHAATFQLAFACMLYECTCWLATWGLRPPEGSWVSWSSPWRWVWGTPVLASFQWSLQKGVILVRAQHTTACAYDYNYFHLTAHGA